MVYQDAEKHDRPPAVKHRRKRGDRFVMHPLLTNLRRLKLGIRLLSGFLLVALLPTIVLCGITYVGAREQILLGEERSSLRMAQYLSSELSALLRSYPATLNTFASDMAVIRLIRNYRKADALEAKALQYELMGRLISEASSMRGFMSMEIITDEGDSISKLPFSIMHDELFQRISKSEDKFAFWVGQYRWGDLYPAASISQRDKTVALAARRIIDYANVKLMGYILIALDCTELEHLLPRDLGTRFVVSDAQGAVLAALGEDASVSVQLASDLSMRQMSDALESSTLQHAGENHLIITGPIPYSPYRLTLAIPYSHMLSGLGAMFRLVLFVALCIALLMFAIAFCLTRSITVPVSRLSSAVRRFGDGDFQTRVGDSATDEIGLLCNDFDEMASRVLQLTEQLYEAQKKEKDAVYTALQAQINPHFLYNTLDMISWMGYGTSNHDICRVVESLSDFFRLSLNKGEESFTLQDELHHVKSYIIIQEYRMRDIHFQIIAPEPLLSIPVPKLIVQPLVENAIQHGLKPRGGQGSITIRCCKVNDCLQISVHDDGVGFDASHLPERLAKSSGYGIRNIRERLSILYGGKEQLTLLHHPGSGTEAIVQIPILHTAMEPKEVPTDENPDSR